MKLTAAERKLMAKLGKLAKGKKKTLTPAQRAANAERMRARWAAGKMGKRAGKGAK